MRQVLLWLLLKEKIWNCYYSYSDNSYKINTFIQNEKKDFIPRYVISVKGILNKQLNNLNESSFLKTIPCRAYNMNDFNQLFKPVSNKKMLDLSRI